MKWCVFPLVFFVSLSTSADDWPNWRGPGQDGVAQPGAYPSQLKNPVWKIPLPGRGSSTPVVVNDRIYLTAGNDGKDGIQCFDFNGKTVWEVTFGPERPGKHRQGTGSNPSVATDGERLFAYYKSGTLAALTLDGKVVWQTNVQKRYGKDNLWWDLGSSPVVADGKVIITVMQEGEGYLAAFDAKTGKEAWKVDRTYDVPKENDQSYTTPLVLEEQGASALVTWGADHLTAHRASDGKLLWTSAGFTPGNKQFWRTIANPSVGGDLVVVPYGRGTWMAAVKRGGKGDVTKSHRVWEKEGVGADVPSPVIADGKVYNLHDKGELTCLDLATGNELWRKQVSGRGKFYAAPILAGDLMYVIRDNGVYNVLRIGKDGFEELDAGSLAEGQADGSSSSIVPVNGVVLVRTFKSLMCFKK